MREREQGRFLFFVAINLLMNIGLTLGQSTSEGLFLSNSSLGPERLPLALMGAALFTALGTYVYSLYVDKVRNDRYFRTLHVLAIALLGAIFVGLARDSSFACAAYFGSFYAITTIFNTHYWNYAADYFDPLEAKRLFPYFPLGNSLGGFIGGILTCLLMGHLSPLAVSMLWPALLLATWGLIGMGTVRLKAWVVSAELEQDDSSLANQQQGLRFLLDTRLGRWHLAAIVSMVVSLTFLQFIYAGIITRNYPKADDLTAFIGSFLALTNLLEMALEIVFTSRFIETTGVGAANLFHPSTTLLSFVLCGTLGTLPTAIFARINRETFDNAVASACRNLLYNAYPSRVRGRVRALLEGVVSNSGTALGSLLLVLITSAVAGDPGRVVLWSGVAATGLFAVVMNGVRREYLSSLIAGLRHWNLDLANTSLELGHLDDTTLLEWLQELGEQTSAEHSELAVRICRLLLSRKRTELVLGLLDHASPLVRDAALDVVAGLSDPSVLPHLDRVLKTGSAAARARALETAWGLSREPKVLRSYLDDEEPGVRATAAALAIRQGTGDLVPRGEAALDAMLARSEALWRMGAVGRLPYDLEWGRQRLLASLNDAEPRVRLEGLRVLEMVSSEVLPLPGSPLLAMLSDAQAEVRRTALRLLGRQPGPALDEALIRGLQDDALLVREEAVRLLQQPRLHLYPHLEGLLLAESAAVVDAAMAVVIAWGLESTRQQVDTFLARCVNEAHRCLIHLHVLDLEQVTPRPELLEMALEGCILRNRSHVLAALGHLEEASILRNITRCLNLRSRQARGEALEALSNLGDRHLMRGLVALFDDAPLHERVAFSQTWLQEEQIPAWKDVLMSAQASSNRWVAMGARHAYATGAQSTLATESDEDGGRAHEGGHGAHPNEDTVMKHLLFLKKVSLFSELSFEQLELIARCVSEHQYLPNETIFEQGQMGDELYVIVEGQVRIVRGRGTAREFELVRLGSTECFGEMAVLDAEPRSASVVTTQPSRLLSLSGLRLRDIVAQRPEIAFSIFGVLSNRLRKSNEQMAALSEEVKALKLGPSNSTAQPQAS